MREPINPKVEKFRIREGRLRSNSTFGNCGAFSIPHPSGVQFFIIASDGLHWDHVSVRTIDQKGESRIPTWDEMCYVKDLFFEESECVLQYHPPKNKHINLHPHVLHLWRPQKSSVPMPPPQMIAPTNNDEWRKTLTGERIL